MELRLHRHGKFRRWLGARLGGDEALGDRAWRRILHLLGAAIVVYYPLPDRFFVVAPKETILLAALAVVLAIEAARLTLGLEVPTLRPYEARRVGSYVFYAAALVGAIVLFPEPIALAAGVGTALVDPLAGELRGATGPWHRAYPSLPWAVYAAIALAALGIVGRWPIAAAAGFAIAAAAVAVAAERPKLPWVDDDLAMTFAPALLLYFGGVVALGLPR